PFLPWFEEHDIKTGLKVFKDLIPNNVNTEITPNVYFNALLDVRRMYINMLTTSRAKSPELLAQFCGSLLRKGSVESSIKSKLEDIPSITSFTIPEELEETSRHFIKVITPVINLIGYSIFQKVSTYQMGILLNYNKNTSYIFKELKQMADLNYCALTDTLKTLIQTKVLKLYNGNEVGDPLSCYELNMDFE
ncbi:433_t:CDS:2, partial [Dentiscutata erythropus]